MRSYSAMTRFRFMEVLFSPLSFKFECRVEILKVVLFSEVCLRSEIITLMSVMLVFH